MMMMIPSVTLGKQTYKNMGVKTFQCLAASYEPSQTSSVRRCFDRAASIWTRWKVPWRVNKRRDRQWDVSTKVPMLEKGPNRNPESSNHHFFLGVYYVKLRGGGF